MGAEDFYGFSDDEEEFSLDAKNSAESDNTMATLIHDSFEDENSEAEHDAHSNDGHSSDLGYSDDSASLSDAYFFPQSEDLGKQARLPVTDELPLYHHQPFYGSIAADRPTSPPLWMIPGPIQEDVEMKEQEPMLLSPAESIPPRRKDRRRRRRNPRYQHQPRAAQQHPNRIWKDKWFALMFLIHLAIIFLLAFRYGLKVLLFRDVNSTWTAFGKYHWQQHQTPVQHRALAVVPANTTIDVDQHIDTRTDSAHSNAHTDDFVDINDQPSTSEYKSVSFTIDYHNVIALVGITGVYACLLTYLSFGLILILARSLIQIMLVLSIVLSLAWGTVGLYLDPYGIISLMGFAALLLTLGHTLYNWPRIPFAATNLYTALCAMRCTADITFLGMFSLATTVAWFVIWSMAFIGVINSVNTHECQRNEVCEPHVNDGHIPLVIAFLFSFHWTNTVIKNVGKVTISSAVATWWFYPREMTALCSPAVLRPFSRSLSSSLGSICLASLVVQPAQVVSLFGQLCPNERRPVGPCMGAGMRATTEREEVAGDPESSTHTAGLPQKIESSVQGASSFLRACNRWSFSYIGMYGHGFVEAGERALQLFETRGWMSVVHDNLIQNVLAISSIVIGGSTGVFAVVIEETDGYEFSSFHQPIVSAFIIGSVVGYVLSDVLLLGIVGSAVNTVLLCFAAAPFEFERNHPLLSRDMREVWNHPQPWEPTRSH